MAQWINLNRNNSFVNQTQLPSFSERPGAILLVLVGLTAGRPAVRPNTGKFKKFLNSLPIALLGFSRNLMKECCYHRVTNVFRSVFSGKVYCEACCGGAKKWDAMFFHVDPCY